MLNFVYDRASKQAISVYRMQTDDGRRLSGRMAVIFIELPKLDSESEDINGLTAAEKWGKFLLYADDETKREYVRRLCSAEEGIMAAQKTLIKITQDDIDWAIETSRDKWYTRYLTVVREATDRGLAQGIEQSRAEAQARIAELEARLAKYEGPESGAETNAGAGEASPGGKR